ncbi:MAG TPA: DUF4382 domain-containing protein, partial [Gemmatimonadales bacterium]|nr:DUF4382 domain-containing protein [Gemmatimonadales bacterium]
MTRQARGALALLAGLAVVTGCSTTPTSTSTPTGSGTMTMLLRDAASPNITAAVVTISRIYLQGGQGSFDLSTTPITVDLLTLKDTTSTLFKGVTLPAGSYSQLRFVISGAYIEVDNGNGSSDIYASDPNYAGLPPGATVTGQLQMPSLGTSGLKVTTVGDVLTVPAGGERIVLVDFDVAQSFGHVAGHSGRWVMHPVVKGVDFTVGGSLTAQITLGTGVTLPNGATLGDLSAVLTDAGGVADTVPFTDPDGDGTFDASFNALLPGDYTLDLALPATVTSVTTDPVVPLMATVVSGQTTTEDLTVTAASGPGSLLAHLTLGAGVTLPNGATLGDLSAVLTDAGGVADTVQFTDTDGDGTFDADFGSLPPGDYTLDLALPGTVTSVTTDPVVPLMATVVSGQTTTEDLTVTAASGPGSLTAHLTLGTGVTLPNGATLGDLSAVLTDAGGVADTVPFTDPDGDGT